MYVYVYVYLIIMAKGTWGSLVLWPFCRKIDARVPLPRFR